MSFRKNLSWDLIIRKTFQYMQENGLTDINIGEKLSNPDGIWGKLSTFVFNSEFKQTDALYLSKNWERNRENYRLTVLQLIKEKKSNYEQKMNCIQVELEFQEGFNFDNLISVSKTGRKKFRSSFDKIISAKLQQYDINCYLKNDYNYFTKKVDEYYWKGRYICKYCNQKFSMHISEKPSEKWKVNVSWLGEIFHSKVNSPKKRITGEKRKLTGFEIISKGVSNYMTEKYFEDNNSTSYYDTFRKIGSQFNHRYQLGNELRIDAEATKFVFDTLLPQNSKNRIVGYLQEISANPFGVLLISEIQVKIWSIIHETSPVWYFDATGKIMPDLKGQKIYLFSLVARGNYIDNLKRRDLVPIADFLTSSNDGCAIFCYLVKIINLIENYKYYKKPKIIVTDFSWANINALLKAFNNCSPIQYLRWAFKLIVEKKIELKNIIHVKVYLCATHLLKNIIVEFDSIKNKQINNDNNLKSDFIFCFSFLQNASTLDEFNKILIWTYNLYNRKYQDDVVIESIKNLKLKLLTRNVDWLNHIATSDNKSIIHENNFYEEFYFIEDNRVNLKQESPFSIYFDKILREQELMIPTIKVSKKEPNIYFSPKTFNIIKNRLHIMPFWSGILIYDQLETKVTRLTNNSVESWFNYFRNFVLNENKKVERKRRCFSSEVAAHLFNIINKKYEENYKRKFEELNTTEETEMDIEYSITEKENWSYKNQTKKKTNGFYFKSTKGFQNKETSILQPGDEIFKDNFSFDNKKYISYEIDQNYESNSTDENSIIIDQDKEESILMLKKDEFLYFNIDWIKISVKNVKDLLNNNWISDSVMKKKIIEGFVQSLKNENLCFLNHIYSMNIYETGKILSNTNYNFLEYDSFFGLLLENGNHWTCFFADIKDLKFIYFNSYGESDHVKNQLFLNWKKFISDHFSLKQEWTCIDIKHHIQQDINSCGIYVCWFYKSIIENVDLSKNQEIINTKNFRRYIFEVLRQKFKRFKSFCFFCFVCLDVETDLINCIKLPCCHIFHMNCYDSVKAIKSNSICPICELVTFN